MCKNRLHEYSTSAKIDTDIDYSEACNYCRHSAQHTFEQHTVSIAKHAKQKLSGKFSLPVLESIGDVR
jgi:predicted AlkP superfamily phosphohydrolase/phosphomutase